MKKEPVAPNAAHLKWKALVCRMLLFTTRNLVKTDRTILRKVDKSVLLPLIPIHISMCSLLLVKINNSCVAFNRNNSLLLNQAPCSANSQHSDSNQDDIEISTFFGLKTFLTISWQECLVWRALFKVNKSIQRHVLSLLKAMPWTRYFKTMAVTPMDAKRSATSVPPRL